MPEFHTRPEWGNQRNTAAHSGRIYSHPHIPYSVYAGLMQASSMGAYYNRHIRGKYH